MILSTMIFSLQVIDMIRDGFFTPDNEGDFKDVVDLLLHNDRFLTLADYKAYIAAQDEVSATYIDTAKWAEMAIHNIASSGKFSSDRTIAEYAREIWGMEPKYASAVLSTHLTSICYSYEKLPDPHSVDGKETSPE